VSDLLGEAAQAGGWGVVPAFTPDALDTALALSALATAGAAATSQVFDALAFLVTSQHLDGGWSCVQDGPSDVLCTAQVLVALSAYRSQVFLEPGLIAAQEFLKTALHPNGQHVDRHCYTPRWRAPSPYQRAA
jgi:hypothetical protein